MISKLRLIHSLDSYILKRVNYLHIKRYVCILIHEILIHMISEKNQSIQTDQTNLGPKILILKKEYWVGIQERITILQNSKNLILFNSSSHLKCFFSHFLFIIFSLMNYLKFRSIIDPQHPLTTEKKDHFQSTFHF